MNRTKETQASIIQTTISLSESLSTSLGPRGTDKMLIKDKTTLVTNDGATILKNLTHTHPVNKILSDLSQNQDKSCGDGTTSVVVLTGCIMKRCDALLKRIHPTIIVKAIERILKLCEEYLESVKIHISDVRLNRQKNVINVNHPPEKILDAKPESTDDISNFKDSLLKAVITSLSSKIISSSLVEYAPVAVDSVLQVKGNIENIRVVKKVGGCIEDVKLTQSIVLNNSLKNNNQEETLKRKVKVSLLQFCVSPPKTNMDSKIVINNHLLMENIIKEEREYILDLCKKIKKSGTDLLIIQKSIMKESLNELALFFLTKMNILVIDDVQREDIEFLSKILKLRESVDPEFIHTKEVIIEEKVENEAVITELYHEFGTSVIVRGSDMLIVDEAERSLHDALCVVKCLYDMPYVVPGGGAIEMGIAQRLIDASIKNHTEKDDLSFAYIFQEISAAFEDVAHFLARNAGMNSYEAVNELRIKIRDCNTMGVNVRTNKIGCMISENVIQPLKVSSYMIKNALETVAMLIKVDDMLPSKH